jgi:DNA sulfur modification protein DndD
MEVDRQNYKNNIEKKNKTRIEKESDKEILLTGYGETVMLWPAIGKSLRIIDEKKNNKQIPPTIDKDLLDSILKSDKCKICGQVLDIDAKSYVQKIIDDTNVSSEVAAELLQMGFYLHELENGFKNNEQKIHRIGEEINQLEKEINENDLNLIEINRKLSGYDEQKIAELHNIRKQFEQTHNHNQRRLGAFIAEIEQRNKTKDQLQKELDGELRKADHIEDLKKEINFCAKSLEILQNTSRCIMEETRERIQDRTKELFSDLTWKKDTFRDIIIDEDYNIDLIHSAGYSFLGSISAGESELLALAFTLALHEISGFDAPILIDTPVARISDTHRNKFAKILSEVSQNKQVLLLFTPSEYSIEVSSILDSNYATKYSLTLSSGEMVANMEAL